MTYIEILNAFWNWRRFNVIPHSAADLYFCLLDFANATKWEDKITIPNSRITGKIDISEKSLFNARNILIQCELIDYKNGKKGQAGTYQINLTTLHNFINKGSNVGSNQGSNSGVIKGAIAEQSGEHNKEKDKDKEKDKSGRSRKETLPLLPEKIVKAYQNNIAPLTPITVQALGDWLNDVSEDVVIYAIEEAVKNNKRNYRYIEAILRNHFNAGRTTLAEVQGAKKTYNKGNEQSVYDDNGLDYDEMEKLMRVRM